VPPSASSHYAASTSKGFARPELEQYPPTACSGRQRTQALVSKTVRNKLECKYEGFTKDILQQVAAQALQAGCSAGSAPFIVIRRITPYLFW